jgi:flagellar biosynthetic protein FlhB
MADQDAQDRNLPASQRKLDKARTDGQVVRSRDLGHFAALAAGGAGLVALAPWLTARLQEMLARALQFDSAAAHNPGVMTERLGDLTLVMLWAALPLALLVAFAGVASGVGVGGWNWSWKAMEPKFSKLNPFSGLVRLVSKDRLIDTLKSCALALILGTVGGLYLKSQVEALAGLTALALPAAIAEAAHTVVGGMSLLLLVLAAFALVDAPLQRHLHAQRLKMSHQEAKQEFKEVEGNVEVKAKVRARMREMVKRRMLAAVPGADLVVMNPTHYAVALKYDDASMGAPRVVAKGADLLALKIRDTAQGAKVPVLQAPMLARALYAHAELDREIPAALFGAVAQVLAYVYQLRAAMSGAVAMPGELPELNVPPELDPHLTGHAATATESTE